MAKEQKKSSRPWTVPNKMLGGAADKSVSAPAKSVRAPTPDDFTGGAISKAVMTESLQHPATIYPLAGSALAFSWTLLIAASPASMGLTLGLAFVSASSFVYNYVVKGPERAKNYVNRLRELRRQSETGNLENLAQQCDSIGFFWGSKEARELKAAYEQLADYLNERSAQASIDRFNVLAEDSLRQGIHVLDQAMNIFKARGTVKLDALEQELVYFRQRLAIVDEKSGEATALKTQIEAHCSRINLCKQSDDRLAQLIAESNQIETALQTTYLELADLNDQSLDDFFRQDGGAVNRLNQAVQAARRVEQRLRGDDKEAEEKQNKYINVNQENQAAQNN